MPDLQQRFCSHCFKKTDHKQVIQNYLRRNIYICQGCFNYTLICRAPYCNHMTKGDLSEKTREVIKHQLEGAGESSGQINEFLNRFTRWDDEFCAEHDGTIGSFEKLDTKIENISDYKDVIGRDSINLIKAIKIACIGTIAGGFTLATAGIAAPAFAAALGSTGLLGAAGTGTLISTLTGAALTNASLAAIGGSVAAGTAIITACGTALGGGLGGVIVNKYISENSSFKIQQLTDSVDNNNIVFINGFLQEKELTFTDWIEQQKKIAADCNMFGVNWSSSSNLNIGTAIITYMGMGSLTSMSLALAQAGGKKAAGSLAGFFSFLNIAYSTIANDWHISMVKSASTGVILSDLVARTENKNYDFAGHSLGARVIYYMLASLKINSHKIRANKIKIGNIFLLGGAVGNKPEDWEALTELVEGKIYNCYSREDLVLKILYTNATMHISTPIGYSPIMTLSPKIVNVDCTHLVDSHMKWKENFAVIRQKVLSENSATETSSK